MGSNETRRMPKHACTDRLVIVALSAQPPGVNELCVCTVHATFRRKATQYSDDPLPQNIGITWLHLWWTFCPGLWICTYLMC
jgi:hypothetical protein